MMDESVRTHDQTDGTYNDWILDLGIKLDANFQRRPRTMTDQSPEVFWIDFDNEFSVCIIQTINIA